MKRARLLVVVIGYISQKFIQCQRLQPTWRLWTQQYMLQGPQYAAGPLSVRDAIMAYQDEREGKGGKLGGPTGCTGCGDLNQSKPKFEAKTFANEK